MADAGRGVARRRSDQVVKSKREYMSIALRPLSVTLSTYRTIYITLFSHEITLLREQVS